MKKIVVFILLICSAWILQATEYVYIMSDYGKPSFTTADGRFQTLGKKSDGVTGPSYNGAENSLDVRNNMVKLTTTDEGFDWRKDETHCLYHFAQRQIQFNLINTN
ncbi:MAG TPA: hypothetical protein P5564_00525 [Paludibacteraceae bacterium]|nr:hypothetical protein [Paludibacteraceae bacterium]